MKKSLKKTLGLTYLFFAAFDPQVFFLPDGIGFTLLISLSLLPFIILDFKGNKYNTAYYVRKSSPYFLAFLISIIIIFFRIVLNEGLNLVFVLSWFKALFVFLACLFTYIVFYASRPVKHFVYAILSIYTLNGIINFLAATYPDIFGFVNIFHGSEPRAFSEIRNPYRASFISGSNYYSIGTAYGLITLLIAYYISKHNIKSILLPLILSFISLTGFIAARTAFFGIISAYMYILRKKILYSVLLAFIGGLLIYTTFNLPAMKPYTSWMTEFFELTDSSSGSHLISYMYFWPGEKIFLIGMGSVNDGTFLYTDGGYMQDILFGGVIFLASKMLFLLIIVFSFIKRNLLFVTLFSLSVLAFHFKGAFLYNNAQGMAALYFTYFYLLSSNTKTKMIL